MPPDMAGRIYERASLEGFIFDFTARNAPSSMAYEALKRCTETPTIDKMIESKILDKAQLVPTTNSSSNGLRKLQTGSKGTK